MYHTLAKEHPWVEHLNVCQSGGVRTLLSVSTLAMYIYAMMPCSNLNTETYPSNEYISHTKISSQHQRVSYKLSWYAVLDISIVKLDDTKPR